MPGKEIGMLLVCLTIAGCATGPREGSPQWLLDTARIEFREDCKDYLTRQYDHSLAYASQLCSRAAWDWMAGQHLR